MNTFASIRTRYHGATDHQGSRISTVDDGGRCASGSGPKRRRTSMSYDHALDTSENHAKAASIWIKKFIDLPNARLAEPGLAFDGDYFWTWGFDWQEVTE